MFIRTAVFSWMCLGVLSVDAAPMPTKVTIETATNGTSRIHSVFERSVSSKRTVFVAPHCVNSDFGPTLANGIVESHKIVRSLQTATDALSHKTSSLTIFQLENMVAHLDLVLNMYDGDSGELKATKRYYRDRSFDENNAFFTYIRYINRMYMGAGDGGNRAGLLRVKYTKCEFSNAQQAHPSKSYLHTESTISAVIAATMRDQYSKYLTNSPVPWTRNSGFPYITIHCDDNNMFSQTNLYGKTYAEGWSSI